MRYPCQADYTFKERCPRCGAPADLVGIQAAGALERHAAEVAEPSALALEALLDNVRSAWNVGSIFRSADGAGFSRLHLCGVTPTPEYPPVLKTSLGAGKEPALDAPSRWATGSLPPDRNRTASLGTGK